MDVMKAFFCRQACSSGGTDPIQADEIVNFWQFIDFCSPNILKTIKVRQFKQTPKVPYSFQTDYFSVAYASFVKVEVKIERK